MHLQTHLNQKYELFYPSLEGFVMIRIQNVFGKAILMRLNLILVRIIYDAIICSTTLFKGLASINEK